MKFSQICLILPKNRSSASEDRTIIPLFSLQQTIYTKPACMRKLIFSSLFILSLFLFVSQQVTFARSGCCSWHGGVCGCGCCDGTPLSSTCAPYYPECSSGTSTTTSNQTNTAPETSTPFPTRSFVISPRIITATKTPTFTPPVTTTPRSTNTPTPRPKPKVVKANLTTQPKQPVSF